MTITEKAALVGWEILGLGKTYSTRDVAARFEVHHRTAYGMLARISRVLPIYQDETGHWRRVESGDGRGKQADG